jgi:hypothetical protein
MSVLPSTLTVKGILEQPHIKEKFYEFLESHEDHLPRRITPYFAAALFTQKIVSRQEAAFLNSEELWLPGSVSDHFQLWFQEFCANLPTSHKYHHTFQLLPDNTEAMITARLAAAHFRKSTTLTWEESLERVSALPTKHQEGESYVSLQSLMQLLEEFLQPPSPEDAKKRISRAPLINEIG